MATNTLSRPLTVTSGNGKNYESELMLVDTESISLSANLYVLETTESQTVLCKSGDYTLFAYNGNLSLISNSTASNAIILDAVNPLGGITLASGSNGITFDTSGPIIFDSNADIIIGSSNVGNVTIESLYNINLESQNINLIADNNVLIASTTGGEIAFATTGNVIGDYSLLIDDTGRVLVNRDVTDTDTYQFQVRVDDSSSNPGHNGILLTSTSSNITPEFRVKYTSNTGSSNGTTAINTFGVYSEDNPASIYRKYTGYQFGNQLITVAGPEFEYTDIGRKVVFQGTGGNASILDIGTIILPADNTYGSCNVTVGGVYPPGSESRIIVLGVDSLATGAQTYDTFRWSQNGGKSYDQEFVPMIYANGLSDVRYALGNTNIYVSFDKMTGNTLDATWAVFAKRTAIVDSNVIIEGSTTYTAIQGNVFSGVYANGAPILTTGTTIGSPVFSNITANTSLGNLQTIVTTSPFSGYIGMETNTDLIFKTADIERLRITNDGSLVLTQEVPDARLHVSTNYNGPLPVNDNLIYQANPASSNNVISYQQNPASCELNTGGYVTVYESKLEASNAYAIFGNYFSGNGDKIGSSFQVNSTLTYNQSQPHVAKSGLGTSDNYMAVWARQFNNNDNAYVIMGRIYQNGSEAKGQDILLTTTTSDVALAPRVAGLANGNYMITYIKKGSGGKYEIWKVRYGTIVGTPALVANGSNNYTYPFVCALSANDLNVPGGYVIAYLVEMYSGDNRYQVRYRVFDNADNPVGPEHAVTSTGQFDAQNDIDLGLSDGLVCVQPIPEQYAKTTGGFLISYQTNYSSSVNYSNVVANGTNVLGLSSGADGDFDNTSNTSLNPTTGTWTIRVNNVFRQFIDGEIIRFVTNDGYLYDKIATASNIIGDQTKYNLVLSKDPREIVLARYTTNDLSNSTSNVFNLVWASPVNTSELVLDSERATLPDPDPQDFTRWNQPEFYAFRTLPVVKHNDANTCIVTWENGSNPNVYYQPIDLDTGAHIGNEQMIAQTLEGLRQTDPYPAQLKTSQGTNLGYAITYGTSALDLSKSAVYQYLIGPSSFLLHANNQTADFVVDNSARLGLGTTEPLGVIHAKTLPTNNIYDADTATLILQNSTLGINTEDDAQRISFMDGSGTEMARVKVKYSANYQDMSPDSSNLVVYFKLDEQPGSLSALDSGIYSIQSNVAGSSNGKVNQFIQNGILTGLDATTAWTTGVVNGCLAFDGSGYIRAPSKFIDDPITSIPRLGADRFTISYWLKLADYITPGESMALLSVGSDPLAAAAPTSTNNNFQLFLSNVGANISANIGVITNTNALTYVYDDTPLNDNMWHNLVYRYNQPGIDIWLDGEQVATNAGITLGTLQAGLKDSYIGAGPDGDGQLYRGYMDEIRMYRSTLSNSDIRQLHMYGSEKRSEFQIQTLGTNSTFKDGGPGFTLDDTGRIVGARFRNNIVHQLTGYITCDPGNVTVTGLGTQFTTDVLVGDYLYIDQITDGSPIAIDQNTYKVNQIISDTQLVIDRPVNIPGANIFTHVTVRPSILAAFDYNNQIRFSMDEFGNAIFGTNGSNTNMRAVEIHGDGSLNDATGLVISNSSTAVLTVDGARASDILFKTANAATYSQPLFGQIVVSHAGTGADYRSKMDFRVSNSASGVLDPTGLVAALSVQSNGIMIGPETSALTNVIQAAAKIRNPNSNGPVELALISDEPTGSNGIYTNRSNIAFYSSTTFSDNQKYIAKIRASQGGTGNLPLGRLDFITTNAGITGPDQGNNTAIDPEDTNRRQTRLAITANGFVGVQNRNPVLPFQVSPRFEFGPKTYTAHITSASGTSVGFDDVITDSVSSASSSLLRSGSLIINNGVQLITYPLSNASTPFASTSILNTRNTLPGSGLVDKNYSIHYPGLAVNKYGLVGIGDGQFGDGNSLHYLTVSGNTAVKGTLELYDTWTSDSTTYVANSAIKSTNGNLYVKDVSTGDNYVKLLTLPSESIKSDNGNLFVRDVSTGNNYVQLMTPRQLGAIKVVTSPVAYQINPATDYTILVDSGTTSVILPSTPTYTLTNGMEFTIKNIISPPASVTITGTLDGSLNPTLSQYDAVTIRYMSISSVDKWFVISRS